MVVKLGPLYTDRVFEVRLLRIIFGPKRNELKERR
jgi:hypothetical protein